MAGKVLMYHKELDAEYLAPSGAVETYKARGWKKGGRPKAKPLEDKSEDKPQD